MKYKVKIEPLGVEVTCDENQTILDACLRNGVWIPHACTHGTCGTCKSRIVEGEFDFGLASNFALMDFEREEGYALICTAKPKSDLIIEADVEIEEGIEFYPVKDFTGKVVKIYDCARDTRKLIIEIINDKIFYLAGQYIQLDIPGTGQNRAYSIASRPVADGNSMIELQIKKVPGGIGSKYVFEELKEGDTVKFAGPFGRFVLRKKFENPILFLAGGTGLAPIKAMILDAIESGLKQEMYLFHGVRSTRDLYDQDIFWEIERQNKNFHYIPALSEKLEEDEWDGELGFVHEVLERKFQKFAGFKAYISGPPPMVDACVKTLMRGRLFAEDIYVEKFFNEKDRITGGSKVGIVSRI
ncbi:MAG: 2Fe-2S iron-sulfur cluster-binding protein [Candidatus Kryptonium sp.]|nr:2Fe-2S iron-sulfur cluster-binding protein [Candidatus Kryptonium sp.]MCX7762776.1 2Fe-2S iron-sulfur cluster-binding protein [Candidatus Kryptonium sp.]MDW8108032.1 2Fe-2S iron-sulfur cluster-binding protein [Candidatus Kryptonium sp.]